MDENQIPEDIDLFEELSNQQQAHEQQEQPRDNQQKCETTTTESPTLQSEPSEASSIAPALPNNSGASEEEPTTAEPSETIAVEKNGEHDGGLSLEQGGDGEIDESMVDEEPAATFTQQQPEQAPFTDAASAEPAGECGCSEGTSAIPCASPSCINKSQQPPEQELYSAAQQEEGEEEIKEEGEGEAEQKDNYAAQLDEAAEGIVSDNSLVIVGASHDSEGDMLSPGEGSGTPIHINTTAEAKELKRQRMAELARQRYQKLSIEERKEMNTRRMVMRKRKRQREREMNELERILRRTNDIEEDIFEVGEIQDKRRRDSARSRYQHMSAEERKAYNSRRRMRQLAGEPAKDSRGHVQVQNARKAELARQRYHRMTPEERRAYNRRRTESLRRRRMEEEALLSTPAGQISAEALQRAQQIMERNAARAEKARERYRRKMGHMRHATPQQAAQIQHQYVQSHHQQTPQQRTLSSMHPQQQHRAHQVHGGHTQQALLQQQQQQQVYHMQPHSQQPQQIIIQQAGGHQQPQFVSQQLISSTPPKRARKGKKEEMQRAAQGEEREGDVLSAIERDLMRRTQQAKQVLEQQQQKATTSGVKHEDGSLSAQTHVVQLVPHPHQAGTHLVQTAQGGQYIQQHDGTQLISSPGDVKSGGTKQYVSYMQLPAGATQQGFLLPDGQFVALQPQDGHAYAVEQPLPFDNHSSSANYSHQPGGATTIVRQRVSHGQSTSGGSQQQPIIMVGQHGDPSSRGYHHLPQHSSSTIHVVNYQQGGHNQLSNHHAPTQQRQPHHVSIQQLSSNRLAPGTVVGGPGTVVVVDEKTQVQKAKRAERARRRYHEMSAEARHDFNARRAHALKMARLRDEELCRLGDEIDINHSDIDDELRSAINQARLRRAKRAESARQKYQRMSPEQRKAHNALRDAQRRMRKREMEAK